MRTRSGGSDRGVTMLELLVALAIVGGLWAVAYPSVQTAGARVPAAPSTHALLTASVIDDGPPLAPPPSVVDAPTAAGLPEGGSDRCYLVRVGDGTSTTEVDCPLP